MERIKPDDFASDTPPERIIGIECEYKIDSPLGAGHFVKTANKEDAGLTGVGEFNSNGARIYEDMGQLEYATPECLGPADSVAADFAGKIIITNLVENIGNPKTHLYRSTGSFRSYNPKKNTTRAYHQNFLTTEAATETDVFRHPALLFLATSTWAGQGTIRGNNFVLCQKIWGTGESEIAHGYSRRTFAGSKPMVAIRSNDDTVAGEWRRVEVISGDAGQSPLVRLAAIGAFSVLLRAAEHADLIPLNKIKRLIPRTTYGSLAKYTAGTPDFHQTMMTSEGKDFSPLDFQEALLEMCETVADKVKLPVDELKALKLWRLILDRLRNVDLPSGEFNKTDRLLDNVALYARLFKLFGPDALNNKNDDALAEVFAWDMIWPSGTAMHHWEQTPHSVIDEASIQERIHTPPATRAARRTHAMKAPKAEDVEWGKVIYEDKSSRWLGEAY